MRSRRLLPPGVREGHGRQERLGVGVPGPRVDLVAGALLDDLAEVHHRDPVGDVAHDRQVVGDEDVGEAELVLQHLEQVDDAGLDRHVERRHGLVEHDQLGLEGQRPGDADALALPAGELVGEAVGVLGRQPDDGEQLLHPVGDLVVAPPEVHLEGLGEGGADRHARVEGGVRVLEHDLEALPHLGQRLALRAGEGLPVEEDLAGRRRDQVEQHPPGGGLAAARLADQAEGLAPLDLERHPGDRRHEAHRAAEHAAADREVLDQVGRHEQRLAQAGRVPSPARASRSVMRPPPARPPPRRPPPRRARPPRPWRAGTRR